MERLARLGERRYAAFVENPLQSLHTRASDPKRIIQVSFIREPLLILLTSRAAAPQVFLGVSWGVSAPMTTKRFNLNL